MYARGSLRVVSYYPLLAPTSVSSKIALHQADALPLVTLLTAIIGPLHCDL
jgi:hypothetical protein